MSPKQELYLSFANLPNGKKMLNCRQNLEVVYITKDANAATKGFVYQRNYRKLSKYTFMVNDAASFSQQDESPTKPKQLYIYKWFKDPNNNFDYLIWPSKTPVFESNQVFGV